MSSGKSTPAPVSESQVESHLRRAVQRLGGLPYKFVSPGRAGVPDRLLLFPGGWMYFVETKRPGEGCSTRQKREHETLRSLGFGVAVLSTVDEVDEWVRFYRLNRNL